MRANVAFYNTYDWIGFSIGDSKTFVDPIVYWSSKEKPKPKPTWFWHLSIRLLKREANVCIWTVQKVIERSENE